ncbi:hypothetical protein [Curvivirga sp.]|uniref:hypothetical protein n=1 Tax=Curvivirga sp. TaxID=2856848 RepID=UPI003B5B8397
MQFVDKPFGADVHILDPQTAFMAGKIKTSNLEDLQLFEKAFPANPEVIVNVAKQQQEMEGAVVESADDIAPEKKSDLLFLNILPLCFVPQAAGDWDTTIHFKIGGAGEYTINVANGETNITKGLSGDPSTVIESDYDDFRLITRHRVLEDSTLVTDEQLEEWDDDIELDMELSDDQLEAVAGGKGGSCGAEAAAGTACGADACGAAAGAGNACGAAACAADAGVGNACGAAACGAAVGVGTVCGADACPAAAGVGTACGAAAGVGACAGDVCGAAVGAGVCAGNVCGIDVLGGADIGPCGINVIPLVPGT